VIFSSATLPADDIIDFCKKIKPRIVFHLSDEFGLYPEYHELSKYTNLYIRNYHHASYPNVGEVYMPLGYNSKVIECRSLDITNYIPSSQRQLAWSFIGEIRPVREDMINTFKKIRFNKPYCVTNGIEPSKMFEMYLNSVFVPSERGHMVLDCFRIYEACIAGAIPVVVGDPNELSETFKHEENPPWIFAKSWKKAASLCAMVYANKPGMDDLQRKVIEWWRHRVTNLKLKISITLGL
jgi:hypothetical protein